MRQQKKKQGDSHDPATPAAIEHGLKDLSAVQAFRKRLARNKPIMNPYSSSIVSDEQQLQRARQSQERAKQQQMAERSLVTMPQIFRRRVEIGYEDGEVMRIYLSASGESFDFIDGGDENLLVSWANPHYLGIRGAAISAAVSIGSGKQQNKVSILTITEIDGEEDDALLRFSFEGSAGRSRIARVTRDLTAHGTHAVEEPGQADTRSPAVPQRRDVPQLPSLALPTVVQSPDGKITEIQFAVDETQYGHTVSQKEGGTIVLTGPPGTGKTTVALLRGTVVLHKSFDMKDQSSVDGKVGRSLKRDSFRLFVVTEHMQTYLRNAVASADLALHGAEIENIRGVFLESFVRVPTLKQWVRGTRFPMNRKEKVSDTLRFIKSLPRTLRLCFYHAVAYAQSAAGEKASVLISKIHAGVARKIEDDVLSGLLTDAEKMQWRRMEEDESADLEKYLAKIGKSVRFDQEVTRRLTTLNSLERRLSSFISQWSRISQRLVLGALDKADESILVPGQDDLLLAKFVEDCVVAEDRSLSKAFVKQSWAELVHLVDPKEVLLAVIQDYQNTTDGGELEKEGLSKSDISAALNEWKATLTGSDDAAEEREEDDDEAADHDQGGLFDDDAEEDDSEQRRSAGVFTRSDFPLLAALARVFLARPEEALSDPDLYAQVGFMLPGNKLRYDHVIVDEAQDFTYAELHLVCSLVERSRAAVTVCGDPFQRMEWRSGFSSLETLRPGKDRTCAVDRNYRQTKPLCDWCNRLGKILFGKNALKMKAGGRDGAKPLVRVIRNRKKIVELAGQSVCDWFSEGGSPFVAVVPLELNKRGKNDLRRKLGELVEKANVFVEVLDDGRKIDRGRVVICDVPTIKGLEFDGVFVWVTAEMCELLGKDTPEAAVTRNKLYVACTRAKSALTVVFEKEMPGFEVAGLLSATR